MIRRMFRAAMLDVRVYEEVEADKDATGEALLVVVNVAIATGIGVLNVGGARLVAGIIGAVIGWGLWALISYLVGSLLRTPETKTNWGELARTLGFAQSPGMLRVFGSIPTWGSTIVLLTLLWQLVTVVIAVRQALDYRSTLRAVGVVVLGFIPYALIISLVNRLIVP